MVSKVEFETIDTRSLELESIISHMTIIFEVRTIYRLHFFCQFLKIFSVILHLFYLFYILTPEMILWYR